MGADDDVDVAFRQALLGRIELAAWNQPRCLFDANGEILETLEESGMMLAGEKRRRDHDSDLLAVHHSKKRGAQSDFRLAEANIAANEPVHRATLGKISNHGVDCRELVIGF